MKRALPLLSLAVVAGVAAFVAIPTASQSDTATPCVRPADNATTALVLDYVDCLSGVLPEPTPEPTPTPDPVADKIIGMSAPAHLWGQRLSEVGACGVEARRIFGDLTSSGDSKISTIREAIAAGMMPVMSYKVPNVTTAAQGGYDAWAHRAAALLDDLDVPIAVTIWHEPNGDMTGAQFVAMHQRLMPIFKRGQITVGPILNGFLLDTANGTATFNSFTSPTLMNTWDWFGFDIYANANNPTKNPGDRIPLLVDYLTSKGKAEMPILIGEYNGHLSSTIAKTGEQILSTPSVWLAMIWNADGSGTAGATVLTGDRLTAFTDTKADDRVETGC